MESTHPLIKWAQRHDKVLLSICVSDVHDEKFTLDEKTLTFSGKSGKNINYACTLAFYKEVVPEESKHRKGGLELFFSIQKKEPGPYWPRLLEVKGKVPFLKVDFNRWKDEDESDGEADQFEDGLENLMHRMDMGGAGGMGGAMGGGMGNGGGPGNFDPGEVSPDSDDEELPDLEES